MITMHFCSCDVLVSPLQLHVQKPFNSLKALHLFSTLISKLLFLFFSVTRWSKTNIYNSEDHMNHYIHCLACTLLESDQQLLQMLSSCWVIIQMYFHLLLLNLAYGHNHISINMVLSKWIIDVLYIIIMMYFKSDTTKVPDVSKVLHATWHINVIINKKHMACKDLYFIIICDWTAIELYNYWIIMMIRSFFITLTYSD